MSQLFNMLSRLIIALLPISKNLLISWLQSPSAVTLEPPKIKSATVSTVSPTICHEVIGPDAMILVFWMVSFKPTFSLSSLTSLLVIHFKYSRVYMSVPYSLTIHPCFSMHILLLLNSDVTNKWGDECHWKDIECSSHSPRGRATLHQQGLLKEGPGWVRRQGEWGGSGGERLL